MTSHNTEGLYPKEADPNLFSFSDVFDPVDFTGAVRVFTMDPAVLVLASSGCDCCTVRVFTMDPAALV
jgi:hypothetical protein